MKKLTQRISQHLNSRPRIPAESLLLDRILGQMHGQCRAVILYGSRISDLSAATDSIYDFFVLVDSYADAMPEKTMGKLVGKMIPPAVFFLPPTDHSPGAKYCVITIEDLLKETSGSAHDFYHIGRFSKAMALLYTHGNSSAEAVALAQTRAITTALPMALARLEPQFSLEDFIHTFLYLSYEADFRVEQGNKVEKLFAAAREYYLEVFALALNLDGMQPGDDGLYHNPLSGEDRARIDGRMKRLFGRSRRRAVTRWFTGIATFDQWVEYAILKVERSTGKPLELTNRQKKHPLIFAWPKLWELYRSGDLKSGAGDEGENS